MMAHYLDANPDLRGMVLHHSERGQMVPIAEQGEFTCFANRSVVDRHPIPSPLSARDFIVAMEVLGHRFQIHRFRVDGPERLLLSRAIDAEPPSWQARTNALLEAFGRGRAAEGIAFLRERDGGAA